VGRGAAIEALSAITEVAVDAGKQAEVTLTIDPEYPFQTDPRRQGVIAGTVLDEFGDPLEGAAVRLWHPTGTWRLLEQIGPVMKTDDRGRISWRSVTAVPRHLP
jgi:protocatechuate 3,4-dioxygenase beta subunit